MNNSSNTNLVLKEKFNTNKVELMISLTIFKLR